MSTKVFYWQRPSCHMSTKKQKHWLRMTACMVHWRSWVKMGTYNRQIIAILRSRKVVYINRPVILERLAINVLVLTICRRARFVWKPYIIPCTDWTKMPMNLQILPMNIDSRSLEDFWDDITNFVFSFATWWPPYTTLHEQWWDDMSYRIFYLGIHLGILP